MPKTLAFHELVEAVEGLPEDQQAHLVELVKKRLAESSRQRLIDEVEAGREEHRQKQSKLTTVDDLMREMSE